MAFLRALIFLNVSIMLGSTQAASPIKSDMPIAYELTDSNFEHDTQATTGSTTGDWLILFCEFQRFKVCREYAPFWNELAGMLRGQTTVAFVDV